MGERAKLLRRIQVCDFALIETGLYLNTHPDCAQALSYYRQTQALRKEAAALYEENYGPLTLTSESAAEDYWRWAEGPWPWEGEE